MTHETHITHIYIRKVGNTMKRNEIIEIIEANKRRRTKTIETWIRAMNSIIDDRDQSKRMWFWSENGNSASRRWKEAQLGRTTSVEMNGLTITYDRDVSMSRQNVYVNETLEGKLADGTEIKITVADLRKLIEGYKEIVDKR